jgi:hypothetical protein
MKTVEMVRDFPYCPLPQVTMQYRAGRTYPRVPEAAVAEILKAGAGKVVDGKAEPERSEIQETDEGSAKAGS